MRYTCAFKTRDFTAAAAMPQGEYQPLRFSWSAVGGPEAAEIQVAGNPHALLALFNYLRTPVEILDEQGRAVWWGYVEEVRVQVGNTEIGLTLNGMANKVAISYSSGGTTTLTDFASDPASINTYGTIERIETLSDLTATIAAQRRDIMLATLKNPLPIPVSQAGGTPNTARLLCAGWWKTFTWKYFSRSELTESEDETGGLSSKMIYLDFGQWATEGQYLFGPDRVALADRHTIESASAFTVDTLEVIWENSNLDASTILQLAICKQDFPSGDLPGTCLCGWNGAASTVYNWGAHPMSPAVSLSPDEKIFIAVGVYNDPYGSRPCIRGSFDHSSGSWIQQRRDGAGHWFARTDSSPNEGYTTEAVEDYPYLLWKIHGTQEHTVQIATICAANEFVTTADIRNTSGISDNVYQDGTQTQQDVILKLLEAGTTNTKRLLAYVTRERVLRVYEEPAQDRATALKMETGGKFYDANGFPLKDTPIAQWCVVKDVALPPGAVADPTLFFIEYVEYDIETNAWTIESKDSFEPWKLGGIKE